MIRINLARKKTPSYAVGASRSAEGAGLSALSGAFEGGAKNLLPILMTLGLPISVGYGATLYLDSYIEQKTAEIQKSITDRGKEKEKLQKELQSVKGYEEIKKQLERNSYVIRNKIDTIERLIQDRDFSSKSMMVLAQSLPKEVWITDFNISEKNYQISGSSLDAGMISDFMTRLQKSIYYKDIQLLSSSLTDTYSGKADFKLQGRME